MSRIEEVEQLVQAFWEENDVQVQATQLRKIGLNCSILRMDARAFLRAKSAEKTVAKSDFFCEECGISFGNERGLLAHRGMKHKTKA